MRFMSMRFWFVEMIIYASFICLIAPRVAAAGVIATFPSKFPEWTTTVHLALPDNGVKPKALVIFLPGTDGIAELNLLGDLREPTFRPDSVNGLSELLTSHGFAFAKFNLRGIRELDTCVRGDTPEARVSAFVRDCWVNELRGKMDYRNVEADMLDAINEIRLHPSVVGLKTIFLPYSEGGIHLAYLINSGHVSADGIVGIGVPTFSPFDNTMLQHGNVIAMTRVRDAIRRSRGRGIAPGEIFYVFPNMETMEKAEIIGMFIQFPLIRMREWRLVQQKTKLDLQREHKFWLNSPRDIVYEGSVLNVDVPAAASLGWLRDALERRQDLHSQLRSFAGSMILLFGALDFRVPHDAPSACGRKRSAKRRCEIQIIPDVGHGLFAADETVPVTVLNRVLDSVETVLRDSK